MVYQYGLRDNGEAFWTGSFNTSRQGPVQRPQISETVCCPLEPVPEPDPLDPLSIDSLLNRKNEPSPKTKFPSIHQLHEGWHAAMNPLTVPMSRIEIPC